MYGLHTQPSWPPDVNRNTEECWRIEYMCCEDVWVSWWVGGTLLTVQCPPNMSTTKNRWWPFILQTERESFTFQSKRKQPIWLTVFWSKNPASYLSSHIIRLWWEPRGPLEEKQKRLAVEKNLLPVRYHLEIES